RLCFFRMILSEKSATFRDHALADQGKAGKHGDEFALPMHSSLAKDRLDPVPGRFARNAEGGGGRRERVPLEEPFAKQDFGGGQVKLRGKNGEVAGLPLVRLRVADEYQNHGFPSEYRKRAASRPSGDRQGGQGKYPASASVADMDLGQIGR